MLRMTRISADRKGGTRRRDRPRGHLRLAWFRVLPRSFSSLIRHCTVPAVRGAPDPSPKLGGAEEPRRRGEVRAEAGADLCVTIRVGTPG